jgi:hypothetical protein
VVRVSCWTRSNPQPWAVMISYGTPRLHVSELEGSTFRCSHGTAITGVRAFELNPSIGDRITICVHCRADDDFPTSALILHPVQTSTRELPMSLRSQSPNQFGIDSRSVLVLVVCE